MAWFLRLQAMFTLSALSHNHQLLSFYCHTQLMTWTDSMVHGYYSSMDVSIPIKQHHRMLQECWVQGQMYWVILCSDIYSKSIKIICN